ncbi:amidohydrolase family protein [Micromonosporaceae bacterium B7E4]
MNGRLPFVDTHVHFHDRTHPTLRYQWLEWDAPLDEMVGEEGAIRSKHYRAEDFLAETRFQNVKATIHVQAAVGSPDPVDETRWLHEAYARTSTPNAVIAAVDLASPDAADTLARHLQFPLVRGIRDLRSDDYLSNPAWLRGYAAMEGYDLVCCDDPYIEQMPLARRLAEEHPGVTLCIDHAAHPGFRGIPRQPSGGDNHWRDAIREVAKAENVVIKMSGFGMSDRQWTPKAIRPWILECIEAFGTERAFFGTNWPLDRLYSSYGDVLDAYAAATADFTAKEREALFSGNAERIFRIEGTNG